MKRFFLSKSSPWGQKLKLYFIAGVTGAIVGVLVLTPIHDYVESHKQSDTIASSIDFLWRQIKELLNGNLPQNSLIPFYAQIGAMLGLLMQGIYGLFNRRSQQIDFLKMAMDKDMPAIIRQGEGAFLEFKSTFRWDMQQSRTNRLLECVVLKTIAGFLNSKQGGTLLIGVSDSGEIIGLKNDYKTLKKQNQDGFEQVIMTAIADNLGADLCAHVSILFHSITDKTICRLIVSPSARPVYIKDGNNTKFYIRTGAATRDLNIQEAVEFVQRRWESAR
jgi:hypothetical protein